MTEASFFILRRSQVNPTYLNLYDWHKKMLSGGRAFFSLKEQSFAHYLIYIFTWKAAKNFTLDDPESHCKREAYEGAYKRKTLSEIRY